MNIRPCSVNGIEFDALINESRAYTSEVPEYAVEAGYSVSDNISIKPMTLEITGYLTNTPVTWENHGTGRVTSIVAQLENLYHTRQLVTVVTSTDIYSSMAIVSLTVPKDETNKTSREIRMSLKKVAVVSSQTTTIPAAYIRGGDTGATAGTAGIGNNGGTGGASGASSSTNDSGQTESENKASILYNLAYK